MSTARERFDKADGHEETDPIERLRFFCSQAMGGQDWLDVEPFFNAVITERDALAAKLAELEGQEPVAYIDKGTGRPHWYPGALPNNLQHGTKLYARPVPAAQPVNARLLSAARAVVARWETPLWKDAPATAEFIYELRDAIAVCAESAPKAVRLTEDEIVEIRRVLAGLGCDTPWSQTIRDIENAVLRKNGIEVAE